MREKEAIINKMEIAIDRENFFLIIGDHFTTLQIHLKT